MKIVLMSGGSGKRLWPLSNDMRSKQFLKVLKNDEGQMESMVQRVWRQLEAAGLAGDTLVAVGAKQAELVGNQLPDSLFAVVEPERRDTFPAIALTAAYLYSIVGTDLNEVVAVLPVDPYVEQDFFAKVKELEAVVRDTEAELALIGVKPTYPSSKYGYIIPARDASPAAVRPFQADAPSGGGYREVARFVEKPTEEAAETLIAQGALWNCGVFAFRLHTVIQLLIDKGYPIQFEEMLKQYHRLPINSFDYEVVEKLRDIVVTPYDGYWKDLGTWNTLTEEMNVNVIGRGLVDDQSVNTHVVNELDMLVTVIGLSDVVVAASPDGILVADKAKSPKLKEMLKHIEQRPMFEERRWGDCRVLDYKQLEGGQEVATRAVRVSAGQSLSYHLHLNRDEYWTIVSGTGRFVKDQQFKQIRAGDVLHIPAGTPHSMLAETDLEWIEVQMGSGLASDDIIRLYYQWDEVERHCEVRGSSAG
ncbi:sugar phosphate nucleotidyltransferase [Cohnella nanjingensis]|uniref:Cupin domain-containing protein n=1 Tax=Cohnella nanjingensis TaxID=1387779 RepID=A0A7X0VFW6_9BACL|nr:sugar phosphate nucleotidyltransferase [Cohnella nanjingensis]MBB6671708.1 cupin domain-containing protein [Cohnella nanjingensis]